MLTSAHLVARLKGHDLRDVALRADVDKKTLQRFIAGTNKPMLDTANRVMAAIEAIEAAAKKPARSKSHQPGA